ncbi:hypothetical protein GCM10009555_078110 [Acrocarpospora macrocephala]|uniref:Clp R domain-containing protein n=1 Tax=Acrocarpospora macrocephala TaxID=150177 RepID=A0A5M3X3J0_9ACTN|nr:hypothetical protein Amac_092920 [Acrocarpospora macrocephala]
MFERFTDRSRRVVVLAQEEARLLQHNYIGTEHILLGLVREDEGVAAQALRDCGIDLAGVREKVREVIGLGTSAPMGHIPFTPRAKKVLELSLREALQFSHNYIGTEHILLGLIREGEGVAAQVLYEQGAHLQRVRERILDILGQPPGERPDEPLSQTFDPLSAAVTRRMNVQYPLLLRIQASLDAINRRLDAMGAPPDPGVPVKETPDEETPEEEAS